MLLDTIVAISTPIGEGAIGIVRMSGPDAFEIVDGLFKPKGQMTPWEDKKFKYGHIVDGESIVDEVMVVKMSAPKTYTCEDIVEINCHGGAVPIREILKLCIREGARMAEKGEFTKRAFLNGRIDLAQAESVMDLVSSKTKKGFDIAINQLSGQLSSRVEDIRNKLIALMAEVEVCIDYPEEDIEEITYATIEEKLRVSKNELEKLLRSAESGKIIREGLSTVIIGKPNVGKSSLMNALLKDARAIVTDIPGTTRDTIEEFLSIDGIPIKLVDTAGIRETQDIVEKMGVEKSKSYFNLADLVIFMLNGSEPLSSDDHVLMEKVQDKPAIILINKSDLQQNIEIEHIRERFGEKHIINTSMSNESGLEALESAIKEIVYGQTDIFDSESALSNTRHISLVESALKHVNEAQKAVHSSLPYDFVEVDVKAAIMQLGFVTGDSVESDLINTIFSQFCLGK
jgi:tRNA modification GTPase